MSGIVNISDAFVSYSRRNVVFARKLCDAFKENSLEVWADWEDIPKGANWRAEIEAGVAGADAFIFIISPDSVLSEECRKEVEMAVAGNKRFVPVLHVDLSKEDYDQMHPAIGSHNWIFARDEDDWDAAFAEIMRTIQTDLDHVRVHTRFLVRANEWVNSNRNDSLLLIGQELEEAENWVLASGEKKPHPTELHHDYVRNSRNAAIRRRRIVTMGVSVTAIIFALAVLSFVLFQQSESNLSLAQVRGTQVAYQAATSDTNAILAGNNAATSNANAATAISAQNEALANASRANANATLSARNAATSDANAATAVAAQAVALRESTVSRSLAMASSAQQIFNTDQIAAVALAINSIAIVNPPLTSQRIFRNTAYAPGARRIFEGHADWVRAVAYSPDGNYIASGSDDATVILWDNATGEAIQYFVGHTDWIRDLAFTPDGSRLLTAADDETLKLWDVATGDALQTYEGHYNWIHDLDISHQGQYIVSVDEAGGAIVWNLATGDILTEFYEDGLFLTTAVFSADDSTVFSGACTHWDADFCYQSDIVIWDALSGEILNRYEEADYDYIHSLAINAQGTRLATGSCSAFDRNSLCITGEIIIWYINDSGVEIELFSSAHKNIISALAFDSTGERLVSGSMDGTVAYWDFERNKAITQYYSGHTNEVHDVTFNPDSTRILSGGADYRLIEWDVNPGSMIHAFITHDDWVNTVAFSADGTKALSGSWDGTMLLWDVETGEQLQIFDGSDDGIESVAINLDGTMAVSAAWDGVVTLWDIDTGEALATLEGHRDAAMEAAFTPDGQHILTASLDTTLILWDIETGNAIRILNGHNDAVNTFAISPDGKTVVSGGCAGRDRNQACDGGQVIVWDLDSGEIRHSEELFADEVAAVAFAPDGSSFVVTSWDGHVTLFDATSYAPIRSFVGHSGPALSAAFSPNQEQPTLATGGIDHNVILWDVTSGEEIQRFSGHGDFVRSVAFSPTQPKLLSGSSDQTMKLWRLDTLDQLVNWTYENRYVRTLTCDERQLYGLGSSECQ